jgi:hypothetical protein
MPAAHTHKEGEGNGRQRKEGPPRRYARQHAGLSTPHDPTNATAWCSGPLLRGSCAFERLRASPPVGPTLHAMPRRQARAECSARPGTLVTTEWQWSFDVLATFPASVYVPGERSRS